MNQTKPTSTQPTPEAAPPPHHQGLLVSRKAIIVIVSIVVLVLGAVAVLATFGPRQAAKFAKKSGQASLTPVDKADEFVKQNLQDCKERKVSFTHAPIALEQLGYVEPLGRVSDGHVTPVDHVYVAPLSMNVADNTTDVVMPADGTVTNVGAMPAEYIGDMAQKLAPEDHRLVITHNCRYVSIFIHVHQLSPALQQALGGKLKPNEQKQLSLELKAGDKVGKIGGNPFDWTLADAQAKLTGFITPKLYDGESWKVHTIDPFSVYSGSLKTSFSAKSLRTVEPLGGKLDYDQPGKLVGNWFREGTNGYRGASMDRYYDGHLALAPNNLDPKASMFSIGNWAGKAAQYVIKPPADPAQVGVASAPTKYEVIALRYNLASGQPWSGGAAVKGMTVDQTGPVVGTVLLQVQAGEKLKVQTFPGKTAAQVTGFTAAVQTYVR